VNRLFVLLPKKVTDPMMTTAMKKAMSAYSTELAPRCPRHREPVRGIRRRRRRISVPTHRRELAATGSRDGQLGDRD
jgi:hypothetical protein